MEAFEQKERDLRKASLRADLLEKRSHASGLKFVTLMMADFVLFLRSALIDDTYSAWHPETLIYTYNQREPFELFARAESRAYFKRMSPAVGFGSRAELEQLIATFSVDGSTDR